MYTRCPQARPGSADRLIIMLSYRTRTFFNNDSVAGTTGDPQFVIPWDYHYYNDSVTISEKFVLLIRLVRFLFFRMKVRHNGFLLGKTPCLTRNRIMYIILIRDTFFKPINFISPKTKYIYVHIYVSARTGFQTSDY